MVSGSQANIIFYQRLYKGKHNYNIAYLDVDAISDGVDGAGTQWLLSYTIDLNSHVVLCTFVQSQVNAFRLQRPQSVYSIRSSCLLTLNI